MFTHSLESDADLMLLTQRHAEEVFALVDRNRVHLRQWMPWVPPEYSLEDASAFLKRSLDGFAKHGYFQAGIRVERKLAGIIGFHEPNEGNKHITIGYWLSQDMQGRGLMTRACRAMVNHAIHDRGMNRVEIRCAPDNVKSRAVPRRLGFTEEGVVRQDQWIDGRYEDSVVYGMLASEWK
jgi:ribosomal-protein-serine acetyltransferase